MFWGKCRVREGTAEFHPLVDHCTDVALTFRALMKPGRMFDALQHTTTCALDEVDLERLCVIAFLHDIGKCNWGFQAKWRPGAYPVAGHVLEGAALLYEDGIAARWPSEFRELLKDASTWFSGGQDDLLALLLAAISHHGRPVSFYDWQASSGLVRWWQPSAELDPMWGVAQLAAAARSCFPGAFTSTNAAIVASPALQQRFAGLVMLADWIGSDTKFFPYRADPAEDRPQLADRAARRALHAIGLRRLRRDGVHPFEQVFGFAPNPVQHYLCSSAPIDPSSQLLVLESETGSGKTEAAIAWFLRLYAAGKVDGLYFALPTRVAARELYERVWRTIQAAFPDPSTRPGPTLLAAPGYVRVDGDVPILPTPDGSLWVDDDLDRKQERLWAAERPKRFLAAPLAVGTIDQALLSALRVRHSLLRSVCLDRHLLVIDEVHASDCYMREIIKALLGGHVARGGHALLLSATLGESALSQFVQRPMLALATAAVEPYPRLTRALGTVALPAGARAKSVGVTVLPDLSDSAVLAGIGAALAAGARILVICNTVARANALMRAAEGDPAIDPSVLFTVHGIACPHHGRFARADREVMDAAVSASFGKAASSRPMLLIGTQTLEQSLDIDADWLVSDICPMDVLLQRIGRLHRHRRETRPTAFSTPQVLVRAPPGLDIERYVGRCGVLKGPAGMGRVYADGRILQRTLDLLIAHPTVAVPRDNRRLVEETTHPEALAACDSEIWRQHAGYLQGTELAALQAALSGLMDDQPFGELHWPAPDEAVLTRLGAANVQVQLTDPMELFPGTAVEEVGIPAHMLPRATDWPERVRPTARDGGGFDFALGANRYRYTRFGLENDNA